MMDLDRKVAILLVLFLVVLACGAQLNIFPDVSGEHSPIKVLGNGFFHVCCTRMHEYGVIP